MQFKTKDFGSVAQERGIESIYDGSSPTDETFIKPQKTKKRWWLIGGILALIVVAVVAALGAKVFNNGKTFEETRVSVKMDGPRTVASGEEVTYSITYRNDDPNPMTSVAIDATYPDGFTVLSTDPTADNDLNNHWKIGILKTGESGTIHVTGQLHGNPDEQKQLKASITYTPANFNSPFTHDDVLTATVQASLLHAKIDGPTQVNPGDEVSYEVHYDDFSDIFRKDDVQLRLVYPTGFAFKESSVKADFGQDIWTSATLLNAVDPTTKQGTIKITGTYGSDMAAGSVHFDANMGYGKDDQFSADDQETFATEVNQSDLVIRLLLNGRQASPTLNVGDGVDVVAQLENTGKDPLTDINLDTTLDGPFIDWSSLKDSHNATFDHDKLSWNSIVVPALAQLKPGDTAQVSFHVNVYTTDGLSNLITGGLVDPSKELTFGASSHATYHVKPYTGQPTTDASEAKTGVTTVMINSDLQFVAQARYFNDQQSPIGSGPLPPKVGQTTTYKITWNLQNSLHELDQLRATTILPPDVTWVGNPRTDAGSIQYDNVTRTVSWVVDRMTTDQKTLTADFSVSVLPTASYVQKLITLTRDAGLSAIDTINHSTISLKRAPLTTNLDFDPVGKGKGLVQP